MKVDGIGESELARKAKISQSTLNRILNSDTRDPRISSLIALSKYFHVPIEYFFSEKAGENISEQIISYNLATNKVAHRIIKKVSALNPEQRDLIESMIDQMVKE